MSECFLTPIKVSYRRMYDSSYNNDIIVLKGGVSMEKYLTGSARTGEKIMENISDFSYELKEIDTSLKNPLYRFKWHFNSQYGYVSIIFKEKSKNISNGSLIDTDSASRHKFDRPLGLYNDQTLFNVFQMMMRAQSINVIGVDDN